MIFRPKDHADGTHFDTQASRGYAQARQHAQHAQASLYVQNNTYTAGVKVSLMIGDGATLLSIWDFWP